MRTLDFDQLVSKCLTGYKLLPTAVENHHPYFAVLKGSPDTGENLYVLETAVTYFTGLNTRYGCSMCFAVQKVSRLRLTLRPNCDDIQTIIFTVKFGLSVAQLFYILNFHSCFKYSPATIYIVLQ